MKIVYISGSITGNTNYKEQFVRAEEQIHAELGDEESTMIFNPARMIPESDTYEEQIRKCLALIDEADTVYMLKGWQRSCGANREYGYALGKKKTIIFQARKNKCASCIHCEMCRWIDEVHQDGCDFYAESCEDVLCHTNLKENAELIAKILDADVCGEVFIEKIRAEIETAMFIDKDTKLCNNVNASGLKVAMRIIDKYRHRTAGNRIKHPPDNHIQGRRESLGCDMPSREFRL